MKKFFSVSAICQQLLVGSNWIEWFRENCGCLLNYSIKERSSEWQGGKGLLIVKRLKGIGQKQRGLRERVIKKKRWNEKRVEDEEEHLAGPVSRYKVVGHSINRERSIFNSSGFFDHLDSPISVNRRPRRPRLFWSRKIPLKRSECAFASFSVASARFTF